tara:strand:- start:580 stop:774 length:195 start_codon:yes stop_codon:yes gene_type:complete
MKTEEEARDQFYNLINDDQDFKSQWGHCDGLQIKKAIEEQEDAFYEWCSVYDDTKHIKKGLLCN